MDNYSFSDWGYGPDEDACERAAEAAADAAAEAWEARLAGTPPPALVGAADEDIPF